MTPVQIYWRDKVTNLLQWGAGLFVLFAGWAIDSHEKFRLVDSTWPANKHEIVAGICLLAVTVLYVFLLPAAINYIYNRRHLRENVDETVLSFHFAQICAWFLSFLTFLVAVLMTII